MSPKRKHTELFFLAPTANLEEGGSALTHCTNVEVDDDESEGEHGLEEDSTDER